MFCFLNNKQFNMHEPTSFVWIPQNQKIILSRPERVAYVVDVDYVERSGFNVKSRDIYSTLYSIQCNHCEVVSKAHTLNELSKLVLIPGEFISVLYRVDSVDPDTLKTGWFLSSHNYSDITVCGACLVQILQSEELKLLQSNTFSLKSKISTASLINPSYAYVNAIQQLLSPVFPVVLIHLISEYVVYFVDEQLLLLYFFKQPSRRVTPVTEYWS